GVRRTVYLGGVVDSALSSLFGVTFRVIRDRNGNPQSTVGQFRALRTIHSVVAGLQEFAMAGDEISALAATLKVGQALGRAWGRAYRVSFSDHNRFELLRWFGGQQGGVLDPKRILLPSRTMPGTEAWQRG